MRGKLLQIIAEFRAAIELFIILLGCYCRRPFTEAGKLRGVLCGCGDKIWALVTPATAHRMTLLEADNIRRRISIQKVLQCNESAAAGANHCNVHARASSAKTLRDDREADQHVVKLTRFRDKKQETVACRHRLGFQIFIENDIDAG